jgi:hypothetical protein
LPPISTSEQPFICTYKHHSKLSIPLINHFLRKPTETPIKSSSFLSEPSPHAVSIDAMNVEVKQYFRIGNKHEDHRTDRWKGENVKSEKQERREKKASVVKIRWSLQHALIFVSSLVIERVL